MLSKIRKFLKNEQGATMIEYALLAALISVAAVLILPQITPKIQAAFTKVNDGLPAASSGGSTGG